MFLLHWWDQYILNRFTQKPPLPWLAITTSIGTLVIALLIGYIFHATVNRIAKVEDDYREMMELKKRAEAADVAKSQVAFINLDSFILYIRVDIFILHSCWSACLILLSVSCFCSSWRRFLMRSEPRWMVCWVSIRNIYRPSIVLKNRWSWTSNLSFYIWTCNRVLRYVCVSNLQKYNSEHRILSFAQWMQHGYWYITQSNDVH